MKAILTPIVCLSVLGLAGTASGQVREGRNVARQVCAACHDVGANQMFPPMLIQTPPSFRQIANRPGVSARALRRHVGHTHWDEKTIPMSMPNAMLTEDQVDEVVSYIMSLRRPPRRHR